MAVGLAIPGLTGCTSHYTMTTRTGEVIETQGKPEADPATELTAYADTFGYHRTIQTREIVQTAEGKSSFSW
ncbi:YgdI/YgdR family lipoprotein [Citrobacter werkmanii]|uniref:YgdI/YgdR family lipoprotein n=1 Tax=Citrobacter werkmanii TaxID=67827 RepID=UPI00264C5711|nr:YgdI/YgdR family lipoprotein [Citrobacter werkmanii]MDN8559127.1 YgdI/YgdR family lipoprotein [Citrobacter werkmanii]